MRKFILGLLLVAASLIPSEASATITLVSSAYNYAITSTSVTTAAISTTGATLIVITCNTIQPITGVSNSGTADTWNLLTSYGTTNYYSRTAYAYAPTTSSSQTFTCSWSSSSVGYISVSAWSGTLATSAVLQTSTGATETSSISVSPGSITPIGQGELFVSSAISYDASATCTGIPTPTSFTSVFAVCGTHFLNAAAGYYINGGSGTVNPTWTFTGSTATVGTASMASFCPSSGCVAVSSGFDGGAFETN